jgi:hypothetical protein
VSKMTDPQDALVSFQEALEQKAFRLDRCSFEPTMWVHQDSINGLVRITYARNVGKRVVAFVNFVQGQPFNDGPCFNVGWAVPTSHRNQGLATRTVRDALVELSVGFRGYGTFSVEAVVGEDNLASQKVAARTICDAPLMITDSVSGLPAFLYRRRCD